MTLLIWCVRPERVMIGFIPVSLKTPVAAPQVIHDVVQESLSIKQLSQVPPKICHSIQCIKDNACIVQCQNRISFSFNCERRYHGRSLVHQHNFYFYTHSPRCFCFLSSISWVRLDCPCLWHIVMPLCLLVIWRVCCASVCSTLASLLS